MKAGDLRVAMFTLNSCILGRRRLMSAFRGSGRYRLFLQIKMPAKIPFRSGRGSIIPWEASPQIRYVRLRYRDSMYAGNVPASVYMGRTGLVVTHFLRLLFSGR